MTDLEIYSAYLPCGVRFAYQDCDTTYNLKLIGIKDDLLLDEHGCDYGFNDVKLLLRPLSDIYNIFPIDKGYETWQEEWIDHLYDFAGKLDECNFDAMPYNLVKTALKNHIDLFKLIEQGKAIKI